MCGSITLEEATSCSGQFVLAINDTLDVISGKWKLPIIGSLLYGNKRFKDLERDVAGITPRMLSKELKSLEVNGIVKRIVYDSIPVRIEYRLTKSGNSLHKVIEPMVAWGLQHRKDVFSEK